jgi:YfiH family protein
MSQKRVKPLTLLFFENLSKHQGIRHFVSSRGSGFSKQPYESLNLGLHVQDDPGCVLKNRERLAAAIGIPLSSFTFAEQIHSGNVTVVTEAMRGRGSVDHKEAIQATDAMVTDLPGICLVILVADCVPMLFFDPSRRAIGVAHAGWRGTLKSVASNTVRTMEEAFGSSPRNIMVGIGPSIGPCCYEVGPEVIGEIKSRLPAGENYIENESPEGKAYLDLWKANVSQLVEAGIARENIEVAMQCTCHNPDLFFSFRYQQGETGRFAAGMSIL